MSFDFATIVALTLAQQPSATAHPLPIAQATRARRAAQPAAAGRPPLLSPLMGQWPDGAETVRVHVIERWNVVIDRSMNDGCHAIAVYPGDIVVRFTFDPLTSRRGLLLGMQSWRPLVGETHDLRLQIGSFEYKVGGVPVIDMNGGFAIFLDSADDVFNAMGDAREMSIELDGKPQARLNITGAAAAIGERDLCQQDAAQILKEATAR